MLLTRRRKHQQVGLCLGAARILVVVCRLLYLSQLEVSVYILWNVGAV